MESTRQTTWLTCLLK
uniref:Uncharacterized protein n=1 Tax=Anguilla anguilla TaxID=7936 RepID=A0A0E9QW19_ANGAN